MPFVTDIYPPSKEIEAAAGVGLAVGARKGKGFPGRRHYEAVEVLSRFSILLHTVAWEKGEEGCTGLVIDPQGLLSGAVRFDLAPGGPPADLNADLIEEDFVALCQQTARAASEFSAETVEIPGLVTEPEQVRPFLKDDGCGAAASGLAQTADASRVVEGLREKLAGYDAGAAAWTELKQKLFAYRDQLATKINEAAGEARAAAAKSQEELTAEVKAALAARRREAEAAGEEAREEHRKQQELIQSELERFQQRFQEKGEDYWRDKIKAEEQRLVENDKKLAATLDRLSAAERKYAGSQQERIKQFKAEVEKRLAAFDQRLNRLDSALAALDKGVDKRLERIREQQKKVAGLAVSLTVEQCGKEFPVVFYAARYSGDRWQLFPPQFLGGRGLKDKIAGLFGGFNLPFRSAGKVGEVLAGKIQALLPGHALEARLVELNLLEDPGFMDEAKAGLARLIDQGALSKNQAGLFEGL
jgi:hypothetical protein